MVKMLVNSNPSNTHSKDNFGRTPLYKAASENKLEIAKFLLKNGANIHYTAKFETILHTATKFGDEVFVEMLIIAGADVDKQCHLSMTPLCNAIYYDKEANAKMLINYGANVNFKTSQGKSLLHYAIERNSLEVTKILIKNGASLTAKDLNGNTPLELALQKMDFKFIMYLIA